MTPANLQILKTEIVTASYAGKSDEQIADMLNVQDRTPDIDGSVDTGTLRSCFVEADYAGLNPAKKERVNFLLGSPTLQVTPTIRQELRGLFPSGNATRQNLMKATQRTGSRADELGIGRVTPSDVADSRRLP